MKKINVTKTQRLILEHNPITGSNYYLKNVFIFEEEKPQTKKTNLNDEENIT